ncbi:hypothetical protein BDF19DRAFT_453056 [Syncephalis fuscata]|nr:hypothetical protein BDF19DRAFT_453056 [Syncephalis fuscata]
MVRAAFIKTALVLAVGAALSVEAFPNKSYQPEYVGLGERCGYSGNLYRQCREDQNLVCTNRPNTSDTYCVLNSKEGGACDENHICPPWLYCTVAPFQGTGVCPIHSTS